MTNDELERIMNFIIERQEYAADQIAKVTERQGDHDVRIARFERSYTEIAGLLTKHDDQLVAVTNNVNKLTEVVSSLSATVDRYITARGNNGSGGQ